MNTRESIEKAIRDFHKLKPAGDPKQRPFRTDALAYDAALAEHLAAELPPTFDAVWQAVNYYGDCKSVIVYLRCNHNGDGSVISSCGAEFSWPASSTPGKAIMAAIKTAMPPKPTPAERFEAILTACGARISLSLSKDIEAVRKVLGDK